jgi:hypothetical protein
VDSKPQHYRTNKFVSYFYPTGLARSSIEDFEAGLMMRHRTTVHVFTIYSIFYMHTCTIYSIFYVAEPEEW